MRYLTVSDRKEAALVSQTWYEAFKDPALLQDTVLFFPHNAEAADQCHINARRNPHLVLDTVEPSTMILETCKPLCDGLQSLSVRGSDITEGMLVSLLAHCNSLLSLDLSCCNSLFMTGTLLSKQENIDKLKAVLGTLTALNLSSIRYLSDATFNRIISVTPSLQHLSLMGCQIIFHTKVYHGDVVGSGCQNTAVLTFKNIAHFIHTKATNLKSLNLGHTRINDEALDWIANVPGLQLEELSLEACREMTDDGIVKLCKRQTSLSRLTLAQCMDLTDVALYAVIANLPKLSMLNINRCRQVTDSAISRLNKLQALQELDVSSCYSVTSQGLLRGLCAQTNSTLTHLHLNCCSAVKNNFILELCKTVPGLLHLDVGSCFSLGDRSVHHISKYLKRLCFLRMAWCKEVSDLGLLGLPNTENGHGSHTEEDHGCPCIKRQPSKIFGDLKSILPGHPPEELTEEDVRVLKSSQEGEIYPISRLKNLKVLDLTALPKLTEASVKDAFKFAELQELHFGMCPGINDAALLAIGCNICSVEVLSLSQCRKVTDEGLIFVILRLTRLRSLDIANCDGITDASIEALVAHAPRLRYLDVSLCSNITAQCIEMVEHKLNHLTCVKKRLVGGGSGGF